MGHSLYSFIERDYFLSLLRSETIPLDELLMKEIYQIMDKLKGENKNDVCFMYHNSTYSSIHFAIGTSKLFRPNNNLAIYCFDDDYFVIVFSVYNYYYKCDGLDGLYSCIKFIFNKPDDFYNLN